MSAPVFEVGVVYRKNSRYYLAVSDRELIAFHQGRLVEVRPYFKYDAVRGVPVEELCKRWGVSSSDLDEVTRSYFAPSPDGIKPVPGLSRRKRSVEDEVWRRRRTISLARAG